MSIVSRRLVAVGLPVLVALVCLGIAGVASAQQLVCLTLDDGNPATPPLVYRLTLTFPGNSTASIVGTMTEGTEQRVVTGAGALVGSQAQLSLFATGVTPLPLVGPTLTGTTVHVTLNPPSFATGTFNGAQIRAILPLSLGATLFAGTAAVVGCP
jgi:hypothetical protein